MMKTNSMIRFIPFVAVLILTSGCLRTRTDVREAEQRQTLNHTVTSLQRENADGAARAGELNEQIRDLRGRVEVVENRVQSGSSSDENARKSMQQQNEELNRRVGLLQESLTKMDLQIQALNAEMMALKADRSAQVARDSSAAAAAAAAAKDPFEQGKEHFAQKDWRRSILSLQKYREASPKGKNVPEATYLIGVSFQELGMRDEARTFYEEVAAKFPKSNEAKKAKTRLKSLKK